MINDPLCYVFEEIQNALCPGSTMDPSGVIKLIDKTISFPTNRHICKKYFNSEPGSTLEEISTSQGKQQFLEKLRHLVFPVESCRIIDRRCILSFNKLEVIQFLFHEIIENKSYGKCITLNKNRVDLKKLSVCDQDSLNNYRVRLVNDCLQNVLRVVSFQDHNTVNLSVSSASSKSDIFGVKCGLVVEPKTRKVCTLKTSEYIEMRKTDMRLIAMHKYGMRIKDDRKFEEIINKLGSAAVAVDFLEVKHTSPVQINRTGQGSTKGASFILYNSARLETLLRGFDAGIKSGKYSQLPCELDKVDLSLLKEDDEWQLIFTYIFVFPNLIKRCVNDLDKGIFPIHTVIQYLHGLVSTFSIYYRRTRILLENREHLIATIHARIILLKCVQYILNLSLNFLNIEPVQYM